MGYLNLKFEGYGIYAYDPETNSIGLWLGYLVPIFEEKSFGE